MYATVGIAGLGLMGGSLARALRRLPEPPRVVACDRDRAVLERALGEGAVDEVGSAEDVFACELVVLATPIGAAVELLRAHHAAAPASSTLTDLCSVKRPIVAAAEALGLGERFVGGHPVAGDHRGGFAASRAELYDDARVWLTPLPGGDAATDALSAFWRALGARPAVTRADAHDELMAWASHLPQVASSALGRVLGRAGTSPAALGPGGRDTTRLAASPPALWTEILLANADLVAGPVEALAETLAAFARALRERDGEAIAALMDEAVQWTKRREGDHD